MLFIEFCKIFIIDLFFFLKLFLIRFFLLFTKFLPYFSWCSNKVFLIEGWILFLYLFNDDCIESKERSNRLFRLIRMLMLLFIFFILTLWLFFYFFLKLLLFWTLFNLLLFFLLNRCYFNRIRSRSIYFFFIFAFTYLLIWRILFRLLFLLRSVFVRLFCLFVQDIASDLIDLLKGLKKHLGDLVELNNEVYTAAI